MVAVASLDHASGPQPAPRAGRPGRARSWTPAAGPSVVASGGRKAPDRLERPHGRPATDSMLASSSGLTRAHATLSCRVPCAATATMRAAAGRALHLHGASTGRLLCAGATAGTVIGVAGRHVDML